MSKKNNMIDLKKAKSRKAMERKECWDTCPKCGNESPILGAGPQGDYGCPFCVNPMARLALYLCDKTATYTNDYERGERFVAIFMAMRDFQDRTGIDFLGLPALMGYTRAEL
jgi:hypothetical protein